MLDYLGAIEVLHNRNINFNENQYYFALLVALGEDMGVAYGLTFAQSEFKRVIGTDEEEEFLQKAKKEANLIRQQQEIEHLLDYISEQYRAEIQKQARDLKDYKFSAEEIVQMLSNLLASRSANLEEASVRDITALIRELAAQGALEGGDGFSRHFINVLPHFNAMCPNCNREFDVARGMSCICPHCGAKFIWSDEDDRFYPNVSKLGKFPFLILFHIVYSV